MQDAVAESNTLCEAFIKHKSLETEAILQYINGKKVRSTYSSG
jgi:hypothetical protein